MTNTISLITIRYSGVCSFCWILYLLLLSYWCAPHLNGNHFCLYINYIHKFCVVFGQPIKINKISIMCIRMNERRRIAQQFRSVNDEYYTHSYATQRVPGKYIYENVDVVFSIVSSQPSAVDERVCNLFGG